MPGLKKRPKTRLKEKARLEAEKARQEAEAVRERAKHVAEEMKKAQEFTASPRREAEAVVETERTKKIQNKQEVASEGGRTKRRESFNAVPLFSGRSLLILCVGVIVGAGLGLVYWIVSPSLSSSNAPAGSNIQPNLTQRIGMPSDVPWTSTVNIQVVNPGSDSMALSDLRARGQYYAAKATSLPFLQYLSQDLEKNTAYSHTPDELDQMIKVSFDSKAEQPTILITATANNIQESQFLATHIPKVFNDYLIAEENNTRDEQYQIISSKIDHVKASIVESQQELNKFTQAANNKVESDPKYVALDAKIRALETELDRQASLLASQLVSGNDITNSNAQQQEYEKTLQQTSVISAALSEAENKLRAIELQKATTDNFSSSAAIVTLNAKISALQNELDRAMNGDGINPGLVHLIATGATSTTGYIDTQKQVDKISEVLVQTQNELATVQSQSGSTTLENDPAYQLALANVDSLRDQQSALRQRLTSLALDSQDGQPSTQTAFDMTSTALAEAKKEMATLKSSQSGSDSVVENLDYQVALNKADNLNKQLTTLTGQLSSLVGDTFNPAAVTNYLVAGNPSMPLPVMPARMRARNALMMGGIVGIGGAWAILNRKWLSKSMSNSSAKADKEEDLA